MVEVVVFDLGGVYFKKGSKIAIEKLSKMLNIDKEILSPAIRSEGGKEGYLYHIGKIDETEYWKRVAESLNLDPSSVEEIREVFYSSYEPTEGMRDLVRRVRKNHKVAVFSGSTEGRVEYLNEKYGLDKEFDKYVYSFETGTEKRDRRSYEILIERLGVDPKEIVYIDDHKEFLDIAESFGIKTILFEDAIKLENELRKFGVRID